MRVQGPDGKVIEFPDSTPPDTIRAVMARHYGAPSQATQAAAPAPPPSGPQSYFQAGPATSDPRFQAGLGRDGRDVVVTALPSVGGLVGGVGGGMVGGFPGAIGGAAAGGALGEGLREKITGQNLDAASIATQGGLQGGAQALGGIFAKGAAMAARPLMRRALGVGKPVQGMVKMEGSQWPDPVPEAFARRVTVDEAGAIKAGALREAEGAGIEALLDRAKQRGAKVSMAEISKQARAFLRAKDAIPSEEKQRIIRTKLIPYLRDKGKRVDPFLAQDIKRYFADEAEAIYKAAGKGDATVGQANLQYAERMAQGTREALEKMDPEIAAANERYLKLKSLERAVRTGVQQPAPPWEVFRPGTYPMLSRLAGKDAMSHSALFFDSPGFQEFARQSPRAAAEFIRQLRAAEPDQIGGGMP